MISSNSSAVRLWQILKEDGGHSVVDVLEEERACPLSESRRAFDVRFGVDGLHESEKKFGSLRYVLVNLVYQ